MMYLFDEFPVLENRLPYLPLGSFPTPVDHLKSISPGLWIKRDDLSAAEYGGNKVRKLEMILADAGARGKKRIVTLGGIGTNHGLATAFYARRLNLAFTLILFHQPMSPEVRRKLLTFHALGADLQYHRSVIAAGLDYYTISRFRFPDAAFIYAGGSTPLGTIGYVNAAFELCRQIQNRDLPEPDVIFCPLGSGGTLAGLALGFRLSNLKTRLTGIQVTPARIGPFPAITRKTVARLMRSTYNFLRHKGAQLPKVDLTAPDIDIRYLGAGYGETTEAGRAAMKTLQVHSQITLDNTYTAKTFAAVLDCCRNHTGDNILYWHTLSAENLSAYAEMTSTSELPKAIRELVNDECTRKI